MPTLTIPKGRSVAPTTEAASTTASPGGLTQEAAAVADLGGTIGRLGGQLADVELRAMTIERQVEYDRGRVAYNQFLDQLTEQRAKDPYYSEHRKNFEKQHDSWSANYATKVRNTKAKGQLELYFDAERSRQGAVISAEARGMLVREKAALQPAARQASIEDELSALAADNEQGAASVRVGYGRDLSELVAAGYMTPAGKEAELKARAVQMVQTAADRNPVAVAEALDNRDLSAILSKDDLKRLSPEDWDAMRLDANRELSFRQATVKQRLEAAQADEGQQIVDRFLAGRMEEVRDQGGNVVAPDINDFINSKKSLDPKDKIYWIEKAAGWADTVNKEKAPRVDEGRATVLEQKALQITTGAVEKKDFFTELIDARYGKKPYLDDARFNEFQALAAREHKAYQANAIGEAISHAENTLVSKTQIEQIAAMQISPDEDYRTVLKRLGAARDLEYENFRQYKRTLNEWFESELAAGRDPTDDDIYIKSRKLLRQYRGRTLDESLFRDEPAPVVAAALQAFEKDLLAEWTMDPASRVQKLLSGGAAAPAGGEPTALGRYKPGTALLGPGGAIIATADDQGWAVLTVEGIMALKAATGGDIAAARKIAADAGFIVPKEE